MLADEGAAAKALRKGVAGIESQAERRHMRTERIIRRDRRRGQIRALRLYP